MLSKQIKHAIRNAQKGWDNPRTQDYFHQHINAKAQARARFEALQVDGKVGLIRDGMDCDCSKYRREKIIAVPVSIIAWFKAEDKHYEYLDGPESTWIVAPSEVRDGHHESRDLALEAFEDGHPHVVYA